MPLAEVRLTSREIIAVAELAELQERAMKGKIQAINTNDVTYIGKNANHF